MGRFYRCGLVLLIFATLAIRIEAQPVGVVAAADPANMNSRIRLDVESYFFHQPARFYAVRLGYAYGLRNERHLFGLSVPFVHSVFDEDYQGFENTTGIGDFEMWYMAAFNTGRSIGLTRLSPLLEISAPTGEYLLGRGAGSWLYKPGIVLTWVIDPQVAFYPQVRYQFSGKEANSTSGISGIPDIEHPEKDGIMRNITVELPVVVQFEPLQAWLSINTQYQQALAIDEYFLFLRLDFGKMITDRTAASLYLSKFIAGQPRLNVVAQARLQVFLR
jgi:hypothetical protein